MKKSALFITAALVMSLAYGCGNIENNNITPETGSTPSVVEEASPGTTDLVSVEPEQTTEENVMLSTTQDITIGTSTEEEHKPETTISEPVVTEPTVTEAEPVTTEKKSETAKTTEKTTNDEIEIVEPAAVTAEFERGTVSSGAYSSKYADIKFSPKSGWKYSSDADIIKAMGLSNSDKAFDIDSNQTLYDAVANSDDGASVLIMYENLLLSFGGIGYSDEEYADALKSSLKSSGYSFDKNSSLTIGGNKYIVMSSSAVLDGVEVEQKYLIRRIDNNMLCICVIAYPEYTASCDDIIKMFS